MEIHSADNDVLKVVERFVVLEVNVQAVLNTYFHFHWDHLWALLNLLIVQQNCKIQLFNSGKFVILADSDSDEEADTPCNSVECLVLLFKVGELEFIRFILGEDACGF